MEVDGAQSDWITPQMRKCQDGGSHEGNLQLITWTETDEDGQKLGWGNVIVEEGKLATRY
jgi:hypothetical protein